MQLFPSHISNIAIMMMSESPVKLANKMSEDIPLSVYIHGLDVGHDKAQHGITLHTIDPCCDRPINSGQS